jgi:hypothetical protein
MRRVVVRGSFALGVAAVLFVGLCVGARAQGGNSQSANTALGQRPNILPKNRRPSGPAPSKDISGVWSGTAAPVVNDPPPMTPAGEAEFKSHRPFWGPDNVEVVNSNDPFTHCDPIGFPRDTMFEIRGLKIVQLPKETLFLSQYQRNWREIWTDGRALPKGVGGDAIDAPDPRFYGYSIGHWDGDHTFVVNTNGLDERTWLDQYGHVKSGDATVEERYTRLDSITLEEVVTVTDPTFYTKPYKVIQFDWDLNPKGEFEEQLCIPTDMETYMKIVGGPAGEKK